MTMAQRYLVRLIEKYGVTKVSDHLYRLNDGDEEQTFDIWFLDDLTYRVQISDNTSITDEGHKILDACEREQVV